MKLVKNSFVCLSLAFFLTASLARAANDPGIFDSYILAMTYHNDFCAEFPSSAECGGAAVKGMVLHGLWPDRDNDPQSSYGFCGEPGPGKNWCAPETDVKSQIPADLFAQLLLVQPSNVACLYDHEWYAHGTCSGQTISDYFAGAAEVAQRFRRLPSLQHLLQVSAGKDVDRASFQAAFVNDLGPAALDSAVVICRVDKMTNKPFFSSINVGLNKSNYLLFPAPQSLAKLKSRIGADGLPHSDNGNCPTTGIHINL